MGGLSCYCYPYPSRQPVSKTVPWLEVDSMGVSPTRGPEARLGPDISSLAPCHPRPTTSLLNKGEPGVWVERLKRKLYQELEAGECGD